MKRTLCVLLASLCLLLCLPIGSAALEQNTAFPMYPASRLAGMTTKYLDSAAETPGRSLNAGAVFTLTGAYTAKDNKTEGFAKGSLDALTNGKNSAAVQWFFPQTEFYDIQGNRAAGDLTHIYKSVLSADLGSVRELTALSITVSAAKIASALQAGDIYISSDGEDWTLAGGWDLVAYRQANGWTDKNGADAATQSLFRTIKDANEASRGEYRIALCGRARYVRVGMTAGAGKTDLSSAGSYAAALNAVSSAPTVYGFSLWGYDTTSEIAVDSIQTAQDADGTVRTRFLARVAMPSAARCYGFVLTAVFPDADGTRTVTRVYRSDTVYASILASDAPVAAPDGYAWGLLTLEKIPADLAVTFRIQPFLEQADGTLVMGETVTCPAAKT